MGNGSTLNVDFAALYNTKIISAFEMDKLF